MLELLATMVKDNIDILLLSETKLDSSFPQVQFCIEGYSELYRLDRDRNGREIILFVKEGVASKLLKAKVNSENKKHILVELNIRKRKWLIICIYNLRCSYLKDICKEIEYVVTIREYYTSRGLQF